MNVLFTGSSGFLGNIILPLLCQKFTVHTLGISSTDNIKVDLAADIPFLNEEYEIIIHAAGKAHSIPQNEEGNKKFFQVNLEGTKNLIKGLENSGKLPKSVIFISTVAVYGVDYGTNINENHDLICTSPYAVSKMQAEVFLGNWCKTNNVVLGILRPSLIAGKNPKGNLQAMINGIKSGRYFRIGSGNARKSILMAEDIANVIPKLAEKGGIYNLCDNHNPSFAELEELISKQLNKNSPLSVPLWFAKGIALIGDLVGERFPINSAKLNKITKSLTFSNEKAKRELCWEPLDVLKNFKIS